MKEKQTSDYQDLAFKICEILNYNKATDISLINISKSSNVADYFVLATGDSRVQVRALMDELEHSLEADSIFVLRRDGVGDGRWVVLDYGFIVVHIFTQDLREYYHIEKLWVDGKNTMNMQAIEKLKEKINKDAEIAKKQKQEKRAKKEKATNKKAEPKEDKKPAKTPKTTKKPAKKEKGE